MATPSERRAGDEPLAALAAATACFLILALICVFTLKEIEKRVVSAAELRFDRYTSDTATRIAEQLTRYVDLLPATKGMWSLVASPTRSQFADYVRTLRAKERFPSLLNINFIEYTPTRETARFEKRIRAADDRPNFHVYPAKTPYPIRAVVRFGSPDDVSHIGRDILLNITQGVAVFEATAKTAEPYGSGEAISKEDNSGHPAIAFRLAVYRNAAVPSPAARLREIIGSVGIFVDVYGVIGEAVPKADARFLSLHLRSLGNPGEAPSAKRGLFDMKPSEAVDEERETSQKAIQVANRTFQVTVSAPLSRFKDPVGSHVFLIGGLLSLILCAGSALIVYILVRARFRLQRTVAIQTGTLTSTQAQVKDLLERQLLAEQQITRQGEQERQRIGRELHDDLGQRLTGASLMLNSLDSDADRGPAKEDSATVRKVSGIIDESIATIRALSRGLSPFNKNDHDLEAALKELCVELDSALAGGASLAIAFDTELLSPQDSLHLYRIVQEGVVNAIRHGKASRIAISLADNDGKPLLEIRDNGLGLRASGLSGLNEGLGLRSIHSRANALGLQAELASDPNGGAILRVG